MKNVAIVVLSFIIVSCSAGANDDRDLVGTNVNTGHNTSVNTEYNTSTNTSTDTSVSTGDTSGIDTGGNTSTDTNTELGCPENELRYDCIDYSKYDFIQNIGRCNTNPNVISNAYPEEYTNPANGLTYLRIYIPEEPCIEIEQGP